MADKTPAELLQAWEWAASDESVSAAGNDMYNFITNLTAYTAKVQADALREAADAIEAHWAPDTAAGEEIVGGSAELLRARADSLHPTVLPAVPVEEES